MMKSLAPIVLFVYNRPEHTKKTILSLAENYLAKESEIFIYSDAAKNTSVQSKVDEVRSLISEVTGFKKVTVIEQENNMGLAKSVIAGVTDIVNRYGSVIVLEDDLVTSPHFLTYMNDGLKTYEHEEKVASIHGYIYPIEGLPSQFFIKGADCWGWATWSRAWSKFEPDGQKLLDEVRSRNLEAECDFNGSYGYISMLKDQIDGRNDSWAIRWYISAFLGDMLTLYPGQPYVKNIGNDESGTHCGTTEAYDVQLHFDYKFESLEVKEDIHSKKKMEKYFNSLKLSLIKKVAKKIRTKLL